jgi:hypothetical protein
MDGNAGESTEMAQPVIINLGSQKKGKIKDLKKGKGELWDEVIEVIEQVKTRLGEESGSKVLVPVVMVYRSKSKRKRLNKMFPYLKM